MKAAIKIVKNLLLNGTMSYALALLAFGTGCAIAQLVAPTPLKMTSRPLTSS
jgi:hypothetical protein